MPTRRGPSNPRRITSNGVTLIIKEWAKLLNCPVATIYIRLARGLSEEESVLPIIGDGKIKPTHDMCETHEYRAWSAMISRCTNTSNPSYKRYGGRGITVCEEWRLSFESFYKCMGDRPSNKHSLDRINNDGNYEPGNCRWATRTVQQRNRHDNRYLTVDGVTLHLLEWSKRTGIEPETIWRRIDEYGWTLQKALTILPKTKG
jgi:hypothetical protein